VNNQYNIKNSITLDENLTKIEINENHKLITYDINDFTSTFQYIRDTQNNRIDAQQGK